MRVYRRTYRDRQGAERVAARWYVEWRDHVRAQRRTPGFADRGATERLGRQLERVASYAASPDPLPADLRAWLDEIPPRIHKRLVEIGVLDRRRVAGRADLAEHVKAYREHLAATGDTRAYVTRTVNRLLKIIAGCGFKRWGDVSAGPVRTWLAERRGEGLAAKTSNHYAATLKGFATWMLESGRVRTAPLAGLKSVRVAPDRRRERRALSVAEIGALLTTTAAGPERFGLSGPDRALVYRLCLETGLRANEARTLTRESFSLGEPPSVTVEAAYSKHRKRDTIPLRRATAGLLADRVARTFPGVAVFPLHHETARMLREDLAAARSKWIDDAPTRGERRDRRRTDFLKAKDAAGKVLDFHALRHTCGTLLANAGVAPKVMQSVMRHSTISLTLDTYGHLFEGQDAAAVESLPAFGATGTDENPCHENI